MTRLTSGAATHAIETFDKLYLDTLTGNGELVQLSADYYVVYQILIQADPANASNVYIGNNLQQVFALTPGSSITIPFGDLTTIYVRFAAGTDVVNWMAMG